MWREVLARPGERVAVVYSVRSPEDLAFIDELRELEREERLGLTVTVTGDDPMWSGRRGRVTAELLTMQVSGALASVAGSGWSPHEEPAPGGRRPVIVPTDTRCAICGPSGFVAHVAEALTGLGVPPLHIATERW
jgi:ferredoxin-NADP reductase